MIIVFAALISCQSDSNFVAECDEAGDLLVCRNSVDHEEAAFECSEHQKVLLFAGGFDYDLYQQATVAGSLAFDDQFWWVGLADYDCAAMTVDPIITPRGCEENHPFVCGE